MGILSWGSQQAEAAKTLLKLEDITQVPATGKEEGAPPDPLLEELEEDTGKKAKNRPTKKVMSICILSVA